MRKVAVIGIGSTKFGEHWDTSFRDLVVHAGLQAVEDAGITGEDLDAIYMGNMSAGRFIEQEHIASLIVDQIGLTPIPATRVEAACASGGVALRQGIMAVASGMHEVVVVGGAEKMTDVMTEQTTLTLVTAADQEWEAFYGATFPGLYAMIARRHMHEYGTTEEQLALVSVKNHQNASKNPLAQFRSKITVDQVLNSPLIAAPLKLLDCSPITDGAAAVILCPLEKAREYCDTPIVVAGAGQGSDAISLHNRQDMTTLNATVAAAKMAYQTANVKPQDIDVVEVHDCFTIAEICAIEDLGFVKKGEGGKATEEGMTQLHGDVPVNPSGGLKAKGHPIGATGVAQATEIVRQLRGECNGRQIDGAEIGLAHNVGGSGGTATVHIFMRAD